MKPNCTFPILVFGLFVVLSACQDQGVVTPDDVIAPDRLATAYGKPQCEDPSLKWPQCIPDDGGGDADTGTIAFLLTEVPAHDVGGVTIPLGYYGLDGGPEPGRPIQVNSSKKLDMNGPSQAYTALVSTYASYLNGACKTAGPTGVGTEVFDALAKEFWISGPGAPGLVPVEFVNTRVLIDKKKLGSESPNHFISIGWVLGDETLGGVWIRVGGGMVHDFPDMTVDGPTPYSYGGIDYQRYEFSGGAVRVAATNWGPPQEPSVECLLIDPVVVLIKLP